MNHPSGIVYDVTVALPACILRASIEQQHAFHKNRDRSLFSPRCWHEVDDHIYWETRENVDSWCHQNGISLITIVSNMKKMENKYTYKMLVVLSESMWGDVASPRLLISNILES